MANQEKVNNKSTQTEQVNTVFNRLRARLYSLMETALPSGEQATAAKKSVRDFTSQAWVDIADIFELNS
jgi:Zn-dependent M32 family carboxypeptidase